MGFLDAGRGTASSPPPEIAGVIELGLNHEQQHQELILTDVKHGMRHKTRCGSAYNAQASAAKRPRRHR